MNKKCQIFTPKNYVNELLDSVGYCKDLYGKKVLENSCGDGNILLQVVQRYISDCNKQGFSKNKIRLGLMRDIHGIEIDKEQYKKCILNLNNLLSINEMKSIEWSITNADFLRQNINNEYQFIIGNPPYITYRELDMNERIFLKENFMSCKKGKFDYCYAFIEKSISCLASNGKMSYLIPSSIFKTVFGKALRDIILSSLKEIKDFTKEKLFDNALVKSAIIVLKKNQNIKYFSYVDKSLNKKIKIDVEALGDKWTFSDILNSGTERIGDYFKVSHTIATLFNEAYVLKQNEYVEKQNYYLCNNCYIEKELVRETATPRNIKQNISEKIIFPYYYENGKLRKYSKGEFSKLFPKATEYLKLYIKELNNRNKDNNSKWFEYGRSQALVNLNDEKLLLSTVITNKVFVYSLSKKIIPYSGMYIIKKQDNKKYSLTYLKKILEDRNFLEYAYNIGIPISGNSIRITSKDIENYRF